MRTRFHFALLFLGLSGCGNGDSTTDGPPTVQPDASTLPDLFQVCVAQLPDLAFAYDPNCPVAKPATPDSLDEALTLAGLDRCSLGFSDADWSLWPKIIREDPWRLPFYDAIHDHAVRAPPYARDLVGELDNAAASPTPVTDALTIAGVQLGASVAPCMAPPTVNGDTPLASAIATLIMDQGGMPNLSLLQSQTQSVPKDLQIALAQVVLAVDAANSAWIALAKSLSADDLDSLSRIYALALPSGLAGPDLTVAANRDLLTTRFDLRALVDGGVRLAYAIESAKLAKFAGAMGFSVDITTPIGRIVIHDGKDDTLDDDPDHPIALLVDTGGDDTYTIPAGGLDGTIDFTNPQHVSVAIDLAGKDDYGYVVIPDKNDGQRLPSDGSGRNGTGMWGKGGYGPISFSSTPRQGAALMGYGMLFDLGPEGDHYHSLRMSQGFGAAGIGVLFDAGGDDKYEGEAGVQGAAAFGIGLLLDESGADTYTNYAYATGFGYTRGAGILYDAMGSDKYLSDTGDTRVGGDPIYYSPQLPCDTPANMPIAMRTNCGNSSFTSGAGFGRRAPGGNDNVYMSGGLGVLRDRAGDDIYTTGVFGEGTGYWFGTGILADGGGNDSYDGLWYVQGSSAHFALCLFLDDSGDDKYNPNVSPYATSIGVGHDYSVSWHIDSGGNDVYHAPGLSLGSGNANGLGVLLNLGGDDEYHSPGEPTLGCGNLSAEVDTDPDRQKVPTIGIFVDTGGTDVYDAPSNVTRGNDTTWVDTREPPDSGITSEHGAGVDRADGGVTLP
jgi:hypothetical protein